MGQCPILCASEVPVLPAAIPFLVQQTWEEYEEAYVGKRQTIITNEALFANEEHGIVFSYFS